MNNEPRAGQKEKLQQQYFWRHAAVLQCTHKIGYYRFPGVGSRFCAGR